MIILSFLTPEAAAVTSWVEETNRLKKSEQIAIIFSDFIIKDYPVGSPYSLALVGFNIYLPRLVPTIFFKWAFARSMKRKKIDIKFIPHREALKIILEGHL